MTVRLLRLDDTDNIKKLADPNSNTEWQQAEGIIDHLNDFETNEEVVHCYGFEADGELMGAIDYGFFDDADEYSPVFDAYHYEDIIINNILVDHNKRNAGIGKGLIRHVVNQVIMDHPSACVIAVDDVFNNPVFYKNAGFVESTDCKELKLFDLTSHAVFCVECEFPILKTDKMLPEYPNLYECRNCSHPNGPYFKEAGVVCQI